MKVGQSDKQKACNTEIIEETVVDTSILKEVEEGKGTLDSSAFCNLKDAISSIIRQLGMIKFITRHDNNMAPTLISFNNGAPVALMLCKEFVYRSTFRIDSL
ncbi:hypothetical protein WN944_012908 [Citrus x changshan-huyou]|uniref:Uncharacterized protein n=1 Tax=Citrus x changshan-huyou TaxID=2935761 RepID=A0AAP0M7M8_9ROSI